MMATPFGPTKNAGALPRRSRSIVACDVRRGGYDTQAKRHCAGIRGREHDVITPAIVRVRPVLEDASYPGARDWRGRRLLSSRWTRGS